MIAPLLPRIRAAFARHPVAAPFLADWPETTTRRQIAPSLLPVCDGLGTLRPTPDTADLVTGLQALAPQLAWRQTYGAADFGPAFLAGYGWSEFIGLRGPVPSQTIACGILLLAPGLTYPPHVHEAEEVYLPIAGVADWQRGQDGFAPVPVGQAIHHPSWMPHAMRTGDEPLAALYLWRGGDLAAKSVILPG